MSWEDLLCDLSRPCICPICGNSARLFLKKKLPNGDQEIVGCEECSDTWKNLCKEILKNG